MVDIDIALTIIHEVRKNEVKRVIFITGDKDFTPMLDYIEDMAEIWIVCY